jgi:hypothetical protein
MGATTYKMNGTNSINYQKMITACKQNAIYRVLGYVFYRKVNPIFLLSPCSKIRIRVDN